MGVNIVKELVMIFIRQISNISFEIGLYAVCYIDIINAPYMLPN